MAYTLKQVTIRANNTDEGMKKIGELWKDIESGKFPIFFDSEGVFQQGVYPVSKYCNYENDENGDYDISIMGVKTDFFQKLELDVAKGLYKKYEEVDDNGDIFACVTKAWKKVWNDSKLNLITRSYTEDYESSITAEYAEDKKAHCCLYIAIK